MTRTIDVDSQRFRRVLGHLPTGVTVITAHGADGPAGMAANSVTSVSLDPPLVLFCPAKSSTTWPRLRQAGVICINVLAADHAELSRRFAGQATGHHAGITRFQGVTAAPFPESARVKSSTVTTVASRLMACTEAACAGASAALQASSTRSVS